MRAYGVSARPNNGTRRRKFPLTGVWLGSAYALSGRLAEALPLLKEAVDQHAAIGLTGLHSVFLSLEGEALLLAGKISEATRKAEQAFEMGRNFKERGHEAWALHLLAAIEAHRDAPDVAKAESAYREAIALGQELGMRPLVARCHLALGHLYRRAGRPEAVATMATARAMLSEMDMAFCLKQTPP